MRIILLLPLFLICHSLQAQKMVLTGDGTDYPAPLFARLFSEYYAETDVKVNYQSVVSIGPIASLSIIKRGGDFGATQRIYRPSEANNHNLLYIPVTLFADAIVYNIPGINGQLNLTPNVLSAIFRGQIQYWNDKSIRHLNPGLKLPKLAIVPIVRADGAMVTSLFTAYLDFNDQNWHAKFGSGPIFKNPVGMAAKGNEGVAGITKQTPGAITYVDFNYASQNELAVAGLGDHGLFLKPNLESICSGGGISIPTDQPVNILFSGKPRGYPIIGYVWMIIFKEQNYHNRYEAGETVKLMRWLIHKGQAYNNQYGYPEIPKQIIQKANSILNEVTYDGQLLNE